MAKQRTHPKSHPRPSEKENRTPRQSISASTLFDHDKRPRPSPKTKRPGLLAPTAPAICKSSRRYASHKPSKTAESSGMYRAFAEATQEYRKGMARYKAEQLDPIYNELVTRVDGVCIHESSLGGSSSSIPSQSDLEAVAREEARLSSTLSEEMTTVQSTHTDGSVKLSDVKLGDTMNAFQELLDRRRPHLTSLLEQLQQVDAEILAARSDVLAAEKGDVKEARRELDAALAALAREAGDVRATTFAEINEARDKDRAENAAHRRRVEAAMRDEE